MTLRGKQNVTPSLRLRADGAVLVEFCISVCGAYKVHVRGAERGVQGACVMDSPFTITAKAAPVTASHCEASGEALHLCRVGEVAAVPNRTRSRSRPLTLILSLTLTLTLTLTNPNPNPNPNPNLSESRSSPSGMLMCHNASMYW